ncbi:glycosyltransferase family 39 protein [Patescibacteria group bacterium]|nr:glycosyltransferase family 39 protein [Patescibacteria group bacterium]
MKYLIFAIIIIAAVFRFYGLNWDQGFHLHPDERMITMVAEKISLSDLNPHFFSYGSFPLYLLKGAGALAGIFNPEFSRYTSLNLVGRVLSALFDMGTLALLYLLAKKLFKKKVALLASFFYATAVLPIQLSHFYAVDTLLTFFIIATLYFLIQYLQKLNSFFLILTAFSLGLALATKISALLFAVPIMLSLVFTTKPWTLNQIKKLAVGGSLLAVSTLTIFFIFEPFAFLDFPNFWQQTLAQQQMTRSAFTFPYTLQYVGKIPYFYELKNIFLWGIGPILATLAFIGVIFVTSALFIKRDSHVASLLGMTSLRAQRSNLFIPLSFFWFYFLVVGSFAIGFMRYMLPLYPLLCLFAAIFLMNALSFIKSRFQKFQPLLLTVYYLLLASLLIWPLAFISIYSQPNTRTTTTNWINNNIPAGSVIATEHWDDGLPLGTQANYQVLALPMYDPDTPLKWQQINTILSQTQYIIIASNRLYTPLQKLTDCKKLPPGKCYQQTTEYYKHLFSGQNVTKGVRFSKVAEFTSYPRLELGPPAGGWNLELRDEVADESFTVYDHPKVMIFKKGLW